MILKTVLKKVSGNDNKKLKDKNDILTDFFI
jgi:hypothetical protein